MLRDETGQPFLFSFFSFFVFFTPVAFANTDRRIAERAQARLFLSTTSKAFTGCCAER